MHNVNIQIIENDFQGNSVGKNTWNKLKRILCHLSLTNLLTISCILSLIFFFMYLCKTYLRTILFSLESQNATVIIPTVIILFTIVSLPIAVGYILLVLADGYLFGVGKGLLLTVVGANIGLILANKILKLLSNHHTIKKLVNNDVAKGMIRLLSGPLCFKIVFCSRLTPIPFGIQNTIFALSNVNMKIYHSASLLGLFPAQCVGVYIGSSLRSMQDVLENRHISTGTYLLAILQLIIGATLIFWIARTARHELYKAITISEAKTQLPNQLVTV